MSALGPAEPIQSQATMEGPPPCHIFRKNAVNFLYDTTTAQFFQIDDIAYAMLDRMKRGSLDDACGALNVEGRFDLQQIESVAQEIRFLKGRGMLTPPVYKLSDEEIERQLDQRYRRPNPKLMLALAETCNLGCKYCYNRTSMDTPPQSKMPEEIAKKSVDWLFEAAGDRPNVGMSLFGGEPLLNKKLFHWIIVYSQELAARLGKRVRYSMTTNATLLDDAVIDQIKKHNFGLMISMDGPAEIHDAQRPALGGKPSFVKAAEGAKRLMRRRRRVTVRCTLTNLRPSVRKLVQFFDSFGFARIGISRVTNSISPSPLDCSREDIEHYAQQEEEDLLPYLFERLEKGEVPNYFPYRHFIVEQANRDGKPVKPSLFNCGSANGMTIVGADGTMYPCHRYLGMQNWAMGNIMDGPPDRERQKQYWRDFDKAVSPRCGTCWARLLCNRPCAWQVSAGSGQFAHVPEWDCDLRRASIERSAYVMHRIKDEFQAMYSQIVGQEPGDSDDAVVTSTPDAPATGFGVSESGMCHNP